MSTFDPTHDLTHEPKPTVVRRLELITDIGGRRKWSADQKAEIMLEALAPGATVSEVARRHDLRPQQVFGWLREARKAAEPTPAFVPVVVEPAEAPAAAPAPKKRRKPPRVVAAPLTAHSHAHRAEMTYRSDPRSRSWRMMVATSVDATEEITTCIDSVVAIRATQ